MDRPYWSDVDGDSDPKPSKFKLMWEELPDEAIPDDGRFDDRDTPSLVMEGVVPNESLDEAEIPEAKVMVAEPDKLLDEPDWFSPKHKNAPDIKMKEYLRPDGQVEKFKRHFTK